MTRTEIMKIYSDAGHRVANLTPEQHAELRRWWRGGREEVLRNRPDDKVGIATLYIRKGSRITNLTPEEREEYRAYRRRYTKRYCEKTPEQRMRICEYKKKYREAKLKQMLEA